MALTATTLRLGTRASELARAQAQGVAAALRSEVPLVLVSTEGDRSRAEITRLVGVTPSGGGSPAGGGVGVFVSALRAALLDGSIDVAVHSCKDLPTATVPGIVLAALPLREDPRDALVSRGGLTLGELPLGSRVGTGSPRRAAQLRALGLGLDVVAIRGNVDTRLAMVADGELTAVVLALAGLRRLGRAGEVSEIIDPIQMLPAPGQGALALECRAEDDATRALVAGHDDGDTRVAVTAERALLAALGAGCTAPVGALAEIAVGDDGNTEIFLRACVAATDGSDVVRLSATGAGTDAEGVGRRLAADLLAAGATSLMEVSS